MREDDLHRKYEAMYAPEDKDQALVVTPYGKGMVIRTRYEENKVTMREIELTDWVKPKTSKGPERPSTLFSPTDFPSVPPKVGDDVKTIYGRGNVTDIREDGILVVRISSWRLAGRSMVTCYISPETTNVQVVRPKKIFEMNIHEKVEHAQQLKAEASAKFAAKEYSEALELYAKAVDAVRYVQHKKDSSNELRADLLVVMITCCNNAATCCVQLQDWDRAQKFAKNALVLLEALFEKKGNSKIHAILNKDGMGDSQLFGTWKVKSFIVIARGLAERHDNQEAVEYLKKGLEMVAMYKKEGDPMYQQLVSQEKQIRKLHTACKERLKVERKKEKQRAKAMFGGGSDSGNGNTSNSANTNTTNSEEKKETDREFNQKTVSIKEDKSTNQTTNTNSDRAEPTNTDNSPSSSPIIKKRVSFADGSIPGSVDDSIGPTFWDQHKEALIILAGVAIGSAFVNLAFRRRR